jgi:ABC-type transporter Mla maintaining outer membrane lipid asymmetry ATPase subunit MlaF
MTAQPVPDRRLEGRPTPERRRQTRDVFVEFRDVRKSYGSKQVLKGVNLKVYRGEVMVILGGSKTSQTFRKRSFIGSARSSECSSRAARSSTR